MCIHWYKSKLRVVATQGDIGHTAWGQDFCVYTLESRGSGEGTGYSGLGLEVLELESPLLSPACYPLIPFGAFDCWAGIWGQNNICFSTGAVVLPAFNLWPQLLLQAGPTEGPQT